MTFKTKPIFKALVLSLIGVPSIILANDKPNIVIILTDDQGYADVSYNPHAPPEVSTPNIDALAHSSIICTQGYTSGHVCSPTRAGLMTGRYQQRFGIYTAGEGGSGVPLDEVFLPQRLKPAGYVSGALGKWHLGLTEAYHAMHRGFDEFYGFMGRGAHPYFDHSNMDHPIYRGLKPIQEEGYLTTRITEEAVDFIDRHKDEPFFLYVAYNAVHAPPEAPEEDIKQVTGDDTRDTLMAMIKHLDMGVGEIVNSLKKHNVFDNTLLIFLTDNGGSSAMHANNAPLRGFKQMDYEGGIHVPFIVSWPAELEGGKKCDVPMWSIDLFATALDAAGVPMPEDKPLDGKSILPAIKGEADNLHDELFWSSGGANGKWAIRSGNWKLVAEKNRMELFDLEKDLSETTDVSAQHPNVVFELTSKYNAWLDAMADPVSNQEKRWNPDANAPTKKISKEAKKAAREKAKAERIKAREKTKTSERSDPEFWYEDNNQHRGGGIPPDFKSKFSNPNVWAEAAEKMDVYMIRSVSLKQKNNQISNHFIRETMAPVLKKAGIPVVLDVGSATFRHAGRKKDVLEQDIPLIKTMIDAGITIRSISLQSVLSKPLFKGPLRNTNPRYPMEKRYQDVLDAFHLYKKHFPNIAIGIIDALPPHNEDYETPYRALTEVLTEHGYTLDHILLDIPVELPDEKINGNSWPKTKAVEQYVRNEIGCDFGMIAASKTAGNTSDKAYHEAILKLIDRCQEHTINPDYFIYMSWFPHPERSTPDNAGQGKYPSMKTFVEMVERHANK